MWPMHTSVLICQVQVLTLLYHAIRAAVATLRAYLPGFGLQLTRRYSLNVFATFALLSVF